MESSGVTTVGVRPDAVPGGKGRRSGVDHGRRAPGLLVRWLAGGALWAAGTGIAFVVYLRLAHTRAVNSDAASQALQAWDMLHGNPLLRGWTVSDVSFYTTEIPQYALVELIRGVRADVVDIAAAMTYTLVVLFAALVAKGTATGRAGLLRVAVTVGIMLAPQLDSGTNVLLSSPDHIGTSVPLLATWLVLDRCGRRWYVPVLTTVLLAWAQTADSIVAIAGIIPLGLVCSVRAIAALRARSFRDAGYEAAMAAGALLAAQFAHWVLAAITNTGGFTVRPLATQVAPLGAVFGHNAPVGAQCLLLLFGAHTGGPPTAEWSLFLMLHLAGTLLAAAGIAAAAWRLRRGADVVSQVLLMAIAVNVGAFLVTQRVVDVSSAREIAPVLPFGAALASRQLGPAIGRLLTRPGVTAGVSLNTGMFRLAVGLLCVIWVGYVAGLGVELAAPSAPPQTAQLTSWLERHPLAGTGLGGYWQASVVTLTSGGTVAIRPVAGDNGWVGAHHGEISASWYDPARSTAHYVVLFRGAAEDPGYADTRAVRATWGKPARVYHVGQYTIWYWPKNLLSTIGR